MIYHMFFNLFSIDGQLFCLHFTIIIKHVILSPSSSCSLHNKLGEATLFGKPATWENGGPVSQEPSCQGLDDSFYYKGLPW